LLGDHAEWASRPPRKPQGERERHDAHSTVTADRQDSSEDLASAAASESTDAPESQEADAKRQAVEAESLKNRWLLALGELRSLAEAVSLPTAAAASGSDIANGNRADSRGVAQFDLGAFSHADLLELKFRLAVPRDTVEGGEFKAEVVKVENANLPRWEIRYSPTAVAIDGEKQVAKPRALAALVASERRLTLEVPRSTELGLSPFSLLRRSVILAEAKNPADPNGPAVMHEIRLVQPTNVSPLVIDLCGEQQQELDIVSPDGIARVVSSPDGRLTVSLPIKSLRIEMQIPNGKSVKLELPNEAIDLTKPGVAIWHTKLAELGPRLGIQATIKLSLPQATLAVNTEFIGEDAKLYDKQKVKEFFVDQLDQSLKKLRRRLETMVEKGKDFQLSDTETKQGRDRVMQWFTQPLATQQKGGLGLAMPGHETVDKSLEIFLKERYDEEKKQMKPGHSPQLPATWKAFVDRSRQARDERDWKSDVTDDISAWADWFWPQCEKQLRGAANLFRGGLSERPEIRITSITSLAFDEGGKVYDVPLVVSASTPQADASAPKSIPQAQGGLGPSGGAAFPPRPTGAGASVGLD
jgi:hypothetical protein